MIKSYLNFKLFNTKSSFSSISRNQKIGCFKSEPQVGRSLVYQDPRVKAEDLFFCRINSSWVRTMGWQVYTVQVNTLVNFITEILVL